MRLSDSQVIYALIGQGKLTQVEGDITRRALGNDLVIISYNDSDSWLATSPKTSGSIAVLVFEKVTVHIGNL